MFDEKTEAESNLALLLDLACRLYSQCKLWCWLSVSLSLRLSSLLEPLPSHQRKPRVRKRAWDFQLDELSSLLPILSLWTYFILLNSICIVPFYGIVGSLRNLDAYKWKYICLGAEGGEVPSKYIIHKPTNTQVLRSLYRWYDVWA